MPAPLTIKVADGSFNCYVARPDHVSGAPVIVVLQEIFGVNAGIRSIADAYAAKGYIAVAPDLFWRADAGLDMSEAEPGDWARGFALYSAYDFDGGACRCRRLRQLLRRRHREIRRRVPAATTTTPPRPRWPTRVPTLSLNNTCLNPRRKPCLTKSIHPAVPPWLAAPLRQPPPPWLP